MPTMNISNIGEFVAFTKIIDYLIITIYEPTSYSTTDAVTTRDS